MDWGVVTRTGPGHIFQSHVSRAREILRFLSNLKRALPNRAQLKSNADGKVSSLKSENRDAKFSIFGWIPRYRVALNQTLSFAYVFWRHHRDTLVSHVNAFRCRQSSATKYQSKKETHTCFIEIVFRTSTFVQVRVVMKKYILQDRKRVDLIDGWPKLHSADCFALEGDLYPRRYLSLGEGLSRGLWSV